MQITPRRLVSALFFAVVAIACNDDVQPPVAPRHSTSPANADISDGAHVSGQSLVNPHFFFLPPAVTQPAYGGTFDANESPEVTICPYDAGTGCAPVIADFTMTTGSGSSVVQVDPTAQAYTALWHTDDYSLDPAKTYRIRVLVAGTELGHADVALGTTPGALKNVNTGEYIPLKDGRTLPINFRIEQTAVAVAGPDGGTYGSASAGGSISMVVPAGAIAGAVGIAMLPATTYPARSGVVPGSVYDVEPYGLQFQQPATVSIAYDPAATPVGVAEDHLRLWELVNGTWVEVPNSSVDLATHTVQGAVTQLGEFAVAPSPVATVVVVGAAATALGQKLQFTAAAKASDGSAVVGLPVTWTSANATMATVDASGLVTVTGPGTTTITAAVDGVPGSAQSSLLVIVSPSQQIILQPGQTAPFSAAAYGPDGTAQTGASFTWTLGGTGADFSISPSGVVTAGHIGGSAQVTVRTASGSATATVTMPRVEQVAVVQEYAATDWYNNARSTDGAAPVAPAHFGVAALRVKTPDGYTYGQPDYRVALRLEARNPQTGALYDAGDRVLSVSSSDAATLSFSNGTYAPSGAGLVRGAQTAPSGDFINLVALRQGSATITLASEDAATAITRSTWIYTLAPLFRFSTAVPEHLYTASCAERDAVKSAAGWTYEGVAGLILVPPYPATEMASQRFHYPLFRYSRPGDHFYTAFPSQEVLGGYTAEGIAGDLTWMSGAIAANDYPPGQTPVATINASPFYRFRLPTNSVHFYTANPSEWAAVLNAGWVQEATPGNIFSTPDGRYDENACPVG